MTLQWAGKAARAPSAAKGPLAVQRVREGGPKNNSSQTLVRTHATIIKRRGGSRHTHHAAHHTLSQTQSAALHSTDRCAYQHPSYLGTDR